MAGSSSQVSMGDEIVSSSQVRLGENVAGNSQVSMGEEVVSSGQVSMGDEVVSSGQVSILVEECDSSQIETSEREVSILLPLSQSFIRQLQTYFSSDVKCKLIKLSDAELMMALMNPNELAGRSTHEDLKNILK